MDFLHDQLEEDTISKLIVNGFDDDESLKMLDHQTLEQLQIEGDYDEILIIISQVFERLKLKDLNKDEGHQHKQEQIDQEVKEESDQRLNISIPNTTEQQVKVQQNVKSITIKMLLQSAQIDQSKRNSQQTQEHALSKLTHMHLNSKKITHISNQSSSALEQYCLNLKILYLFENQISQIEGLNNLKNLIQLSLYDNCISKIEGLSGLTSLRKLYLEKNQIKRLEGLENCTSLEELFLGNQNIDEEFTFDEYSLAAISSTLKYLDLQKSNVKTSRQLYYLENLEIVDLKFNLIEDFTDQVVPLLDTLAKIRILNLSMNPVTQTLKYRDQIVLLTSSLQELDGKQITSQERQYLTTLVQRKKLQSQQNQKKSLKQQDKKNFVIQGKNKVLHSINENLGVYNSEDKQDSKEDQSANDFYKNDEDEENIESNRNVIKNQFQHQNLLSERNQLFKKKSFNINSNSDFTCVGLQHQSTKYVPKTMASAQTGINKRK